VGAVDKRSELCAIKRKLARSRLPDAERHGSSRRKLKASANHHSTASLVGSSIRIGSVGWRMLELEAPLPRNSVVLEKAFADDQPEMEMNMDQLATAFIVARKVMCRMITVGHGWKELEIRSSNITWTRCWSFLATSRSTSPRRQHRMEAPAALPIAVGNLLL